MTQLREFTVIDTEGVVLSKMSGPAGVLLLPDTLPGQLIIERLPPPGTDWWNGGEFMARPTPPSPHHIWQSGAWIDPRPDADILQAAKDDRWEQIKAQRSKVEFSGFKWDGSRFDSDALSQQRIQGALQLAQLSAQAGAEYSVPWTLQDNTVRVLSAADVMQVGMALGQHVTATHEQAQLLRSQIESASTVAGVAAIVWSAP